MYLISIIAGYVIASLAKIPAGYLLDPKDAKKRGAVKLFVDTGGMPSGHSATVMALATCVLLANGFWSFEFAISILLAVIVMADAANVRRATGDNGLAIQKMLSKLQQKDIAVPYYAKGHTPREIVVGALLGVIIGAVVWFIASC